MRFCICIVYVYVFECAYVCTGVLTRMYMHMKSEVAVFDVGYLPLLFFTFLGVRSLIEPGAH